MQIDRRRWHSASAGGRGVSDEPLSVPLEWRRTATLRERGLVRAIDLRIWRSPSRSSDTPAISDGVTRVHDAQTVATWNRDIALLRLFLL
jgi:hypothetical protein